MAAILYEPVFAIVGRAFADPEDRLRAIATVTVIGGLASTAFLPGTSALVTRFGWRGAVVVARDRSSRSRTLIVGRFAFRDLAWSAQTIRDAIAGTAESASRQRATARPRTPGRRVRDVDHRQLRGRRRTSSRR